MMRETFKAVEADNARYNARNTHIKSTENYVYRPEQPHFSG